MTMTRSGADRQRGFTLIELMIAVVVVALLTTVAYPSYREHVVRSAREAAKTDLIELAAMQERIFLNSDAYSSSVTAAYNGTAAGGLGRTTGLIGSDKYSVALVTVGQTFTLTATPVTGSNQAGDGNLAITSDGRRTWGSKSW